MTTDTAGDAVLAAECDVLCRYLVSAPPSRYVIERYIGGHRALPPPADKTTSRPVDALLLRVARRGPTLAAVADTYARLFRPNGPLRMKGILLLAILESAPDTHALFDTAAVGGMARALTGLGAIGVRWSVCALISLLTFGPVDLLTAALSRRAARG